jgi:energy-coupling factor transport system ATP-binding protein
MTGLRLEKLSVRFGDCIALRDVDLTIGSGECVLLAGASGSGKSTLVRCLTRLIPQCIPAQLTGEVILDGRPVGEATVAQLSRQIGVVFQNPRTQLLNVRVEDEVGFGPRNLGLAPEEVERRVTWALAAVGLEHVRDRTTAALSGGERQRLAIAAVLAMGPRVLLLDEPMASLDVDGTSAVIETVRRLNREDGVTVVIVEHRLGPAAAIAGRTVLLDDGAVVADGPTDEVLGRRDLVRRLGLRRPADDAQVDWRELVEPAPPRAAGPFVSLRGVTAGVGRRPALVDLDLTIHHGDFLAVVGHNGAGKTTLARVLAGLLKPKRGRVAYGAGRRLRAGSGVGMLFQDPTAQLLCDTVEDELWFGLRNLGRRDPAAVDGTLQAVDLADRRTQPVFALSLGQQQRLALGAVLSMAPRLLILDEPTLGQDWGHMGRFMAAVRALNEAGSTVVLITHDYKLVHHHASRIIVLDHGRVVADGLPSARTSAAGVPCGQICEATPDVSPTADPTDVTGARETVGATEVAACASA